MFPPPDKPNYQSPFSIFDMFDQFMEDEHGVVRLTRTFYNSTNSSCFDTTDKYENLPINQCVGPFGSPLPWGRFEIVKMERKSKI